MLNKIKLHANQRTYIVADTNNIGYSFLVAVDSVQINNFIIALDIKTDENGLTSWTAGHYFTYFKNAIRFWKAIETI